MAKKESDVITVAWNWRGFLTNPSMEAYANGHVNDNTLQQFKEQNNTLTGVVRYYSSSFYPRIENVPADIDACSMDNEAGPRRNTRDKEELYSRWSCTCTMGQNRLPCNHTALLALYREKNKGPVSFSETKEEREARNRRKKEEQRAKYRSMSREEQRNIELSVVEEIKDLPGKGYFFNMVQALKGAKTNFYELEQLAEMRALEFKPKVQLDYDSNDNQQELVVNAYIDGKSVDLTLKRGLEIKIKCACGEYNRSGYYYSGYSYWYGRNYTPVDYSGEFCAHKLLLIEWTRDYILKKNPGDETDYRGNRFLLEAMNNKPRKPLGTVEKIRNLSLRPMLTETYSGEIGIRFKIARGNERDIIIKYLDDFLDKYNMSNEWYVGNRSFDFGMHDFNDESMLWLDLLRKQEQLKYVSEYYGTRDGVLALKGRLVDDLYENALGKKIYVEADAGNHWITVMEAPCTVEVNVSPINPKKALEGVVVSGVAPIFFRGCENNYFLNANYLSRVSSEEEDNLAIFRNAGDKHGAFSFRVGKDNLQEFYYRVLPALKERKAVVVKDNARGLLEGTLAPEAEFVFYLDYKDSVISLQAKVKYGDKELILQKDMPETGYSRDLAQEKRVYGRLKKIFDSELDGSYFLKTNEESLFTFLTKWIDVLSSFGEVKGTNAFNSLKIRNVPVFTMDVTVSVDSGLLDLEILTKDLSQEELLALLGSYREKKRYHRLQSGDFIDLGDMDNSLNKIDSTLEQLNLTIEDVLNGKGHLPLYRALYVNSLLEEREELVAKRDKTLTQLVRTFKTIKDSDFAVPTQLENVLRPYQEAGCKWLNVLTQSGFGGILADEMGLGKTLQLLAVLDAMKRDNPDLPASLVICPASLVYNWVEEARRFTPDMKVKAIAGPMGDRKEIIKDIASEEHASLYVTSYDLLKRDITQYNDITFNTVALDEAQYIKNQNTAVTKSVKVIKARHRLALTGTPIENRLSELWSIFDYLMPGFLYDHKTFTTMFETPIVKSSDEQAANQLKKMTSPFIMRRLKTDVLKDLPEKMEEIRYSVMDDAQRKLYDAQVVKIKGDLSGTVGNKEKIKIFAELTKLREICCDPSLLFENYRAGSAKREAFIELVKNAIDGGHRMLVFSQFTSMLALLKNDLKNEGIEYYMITGSTAKEERLRLVNEFNDGTVPVFLISLKAGGTGLNLTGADIVIHYDPWWNVAATNQATDRAHRIGQTKQVTVYKMIAKDTIEEKILDMQMMKQELADAFVNGNGESLASLSTDELLALLS